MNFDNPTPLQVGATGTLYGWKVRVAGRVVMGMDDGGETYYWQEYNLADAAGNTGTLVYEETEDGPEWKLFTVFEPAQPMTAAEAATKRVGDTVNLDGKPTPVTLVDQSRVYHIEGVAPEGVEVGDVADYFNADAGDRMLVASWTGGEIEFYEGRDLEGEKVAAAFGLPTEAMGFAAAGGGTEVNAGAFRKPVLVVALIVAGLIGLVAFFTCSDQSTVTGSARPTTAPLSPFKLANGARGRLDQREFTIESQAVVEVGRQGMRHQRREYRLRGDDDRPALLINALNSPPREWHLFVPAGTPPALATVPPYAAAAQRQGARVTVEGYSLPILQLCLTKPVAVEGDGAAGVWPGVQYGFVARDGARWVIARWNENSIQFLSGKPVTDAEVTAALGRTAAK